MKIETFFENFELLTDAPNAVAKLREVVLQLAVQGKLIPQHFNDEPASVLLEKIKIQKEKSNFRKSKLSMELPELDSQQIPYEVPSNWQWVRLGNVGQIVGGGTPNTAHADYYSDNEIPWLTPADLYNLKGKIVFKGKRDISLLGLNKSSAQIMPKGTVIFSSRAPIGYVAIAGNDLATNQGFKSCVPHIHETNEYIYYFLKSSAKQIDNKASGTTFKEISGREFSLIPVPLPPLAEQKRIVEKCDRLLSVCNQIEVRQQQKQESIVRMNESAIAQLLSSQNPDKFSQHWQRICDNFDLLYCIPETIPKLQQAILQLALQGKLVCQNLDDQHVEKLFKEIQELKEALIQSGKIQKDKSFSPVTKTLPPWQIPQSWKWVRLQDIFEISRGGSPRPSGDPKYFGGDIPWITVNEITKDTERYLISTKYGLTEVGSTKSRFIYPEDLLLTNSGATLGVPKISKIQGCINDGVARLNCFHEGIYKEYAYYYLLQQTLAFRQVNQGMGQPNLNTSILAGWYFPLPPLAEQKRIVAKVDRLMSICDTLEAKLKEAQSHSEKLMEVAAKQILIA